MKRVHAASSHWWIIYTFFIAIFVSVPGRTIPSDEASGAGAAGSGARIVHSDGSSITFEITVPPARIERGDNGSRIVLHRYGTFSPPGAPMLPGRTFHVAVPASGDPSVSWTVMDSEDLGRFPLSRVMAERFVSYGEDGIPVTEMYLPEDPWNGRIPTAVVTPAQPAMMGRQRVMPIRVSPLTELDGNYSLAKRITVTVSFGPYSGVLPDRSGPAAGMVLSGAWKRMYERVLVNPSDTERLISPIKSRPVLRSPLQAGKRLKIKILETGVYSVRADSLIASGLSPALANNGFALKKLYFDETEPDLVRDVDIPYRVIKGSGSAADIFEGDDLLVFFARGVKDDVDAGDTMAVFNTYNLIWLFEEEAGAVMSDGPGFPSEAGTPQASFIHAEKVRRDTWYHKYVRAGMKDFNCVAGLGRDEVAVPFTVHDAEPGSVFSAHIRIIGNKKVNPSQDLDFYIRNSGGTQMIGSGYVPSNEEKVFNFSMIPVSRLAEGSNEIVVRSLEASYGFVVNDMAVKYSRTMAVWDDYLDFTIGQDPGNKRVEISGFSAQHGYLVELTDPDAPVFHDIPADSFRADGGSYTLSLTVPAVTGRRFVAMGRGAGLHISNIWIDHEVNTANDLRSSPGPYNTLVIAHSDFLPPVSDHLAQYISWREAQGYRILGADVGKVYDEFNGGLISADAIRRFIRYGVENWGVEFVLLVGDASEDHRRIFIGNPPVNGSPPDYVPAYTYSVNVVGRDNDEVVASDRYYSFLDEVPPSGFGYAAPGAEPSSDSSAPLYMPLAAYPDVIVGRLPVGRELELRALLTKMYRFEVPASSDSWRRSMVLFSDDAWSGLLSGYAYRPIEHHFEYGMDSVAVKIDEALPGGFDINRLHLSRWTDGVHDDLQGGMSVLSEATDSTRRYFTPYLNRKLNDGCLFFTFQGHASRSNFTTEAGFSNFSQYQDVDSLRYDRNHIFIGLGCHISDFALQAEYSRSGLDGPNGDCITEQLLFKSRAGAVGTYASTGFEYLLENKYFCTTMHEVIFQRPPNDSIPPANEQTGARWILGEALTAGEIEHLGTSSYAYGQIYRYLLLGDPMLRIDPGPPLMTLSADWGDGMQEFHADTLRSRNRTNTCSLMFGASDVVALGNIEFLVDGEDRTGDLTITPTVDEGLDLARGYEAKVNYTVNLDEQLLVFRIYSPDGLETGMKELHATVSMRLYNGSLEILPGGESPSKGEFLLDIQFPIWLDAVPRIMLDGLDLDDASVQVPDPQDSTGWEARFTRTLAAGDHFLTVAVGEFETDYSFSVGGSGLVMDAFNFPNPFDDGTNICYSLNIDADAGIIRIYNVSGILIKEIVIPRSLLGSAPPGAPNAVWWDGRDLAGDRVANGTYIYVIDVEKDGSTLSYTGKAVRLE